MTIYIDDGETVKTYPVNDKVAKAVMTLLETDNALMWSETLPGYGVEIVDKAESGGAGMTREEHIIYLKNLRTALKLANNFSNETMESLDMAIKALEQEPCGDAISRDDVIMCMTGMYIADLEYKPDDIISQHIKRIKALPSVTPKRKTGKWIDGRCSECGCDVPAYIIDWKWQKDMDAKYCPNCGIEMEGKE